jgi:hypothetical protein
MSDGKRRDTPNPVHMRIAARLKDALREFLVAARDGSVTAAQRDAYAMASIDALSLPGDLYKNAVNDARVLAGYDKAPG